MNFSNQNPITSMLAYAMADFIKPVVQTNNIIALVFSQETIIPMLML